MSAKSLRSTILVERQASKQDRLDTIVDGFPHHRARLHTMHLSVDYIPTYVLRLAHLGIATIPQAF